MITDVYKFNDGGDNDHQHRSSSDANDKITMARMLPT
jgi:hypothetical protein